MGRRDGGRDRWKEGGRGEEGEDEWLLHSKSMHKRRVSEGDSGEKRGVYRGCERSFVKAGS